MVKAEKADHIVAIDGCPLNCARHTFGTGWFSNHAPSGIASWACAKAVRQPQNVSPLPCKRGVELIQTIETGDGKIMNATAAPFRRSPLLQVCQSATGPGVEDGLPPCCTSTAAINTAAICVLNVRR